MKKLFYFLMIFLLISTSNTIFKHNATAADNTSIYSDGTTATWDDIRPFLSTIYQNTPYISISNGTSTKLFHFNIELFWDLGLYVYGDPSSVQFIGTVNDFKEAEYGYFSPTKNLIGEYRYLGFSINGAPITNKRFPNDLKPIPYNEMTLMKYTELPNDLKKAYNINGLNNDMYIPIKNIIESENSPVWTFTNITEGKEITLRQTLTDIGMFKDGRPTFELLDYAIIYSWNDSGGTIRLFYCSKTDKSIIRYATFSGPVSINFQPKLPSLNSTLELNQDYHTNNTFYTTKKDGLIYLNLKTTASLYDNYSNLSYFQKYYSLTRDNLISYDLFIENEIIEKPITFTNDAAIAKTGTLNNYILKYTNLKPGRNEFTINGYAKAKLSSYYLEAPCSVTIIIFYDSISPAPENTIPPAPKPSPTFPQSDPNSAPATHFTINRKW